MFVRAAAFCVLLTACTVGDVRDHGPSDPDASSLTTDADPNAPDADPAAPDAAPSAACVPAATPPGSGHHNAGQACIACHAGNGGPDFTLAGTLYNGATALAGATITVVDANGATTDLVTMSNGNFYTSAALAFPVHVVASRCPDTTPMNGAVAAGDCNSCHVAGQQGRIHLP